MKVAIIFALTSLNVFGYTNLSCKDAYEKHCSKSKKAICEKMKFEGDYIGWNEELVESLKKRREEILKASKKYNVSARTIVSSILATNLELEGDDVFGSGIHKWLVVNQWNESSDQRKPLKFGIGKTSEEDLLKIQEVFLKYNPQNSAKTKKEIVKDLYNNESDIEYATALLRRNIDIFQKEGVDISEKPEVIVTTHGINNLKNAAKRRAAKGGEPGINGWGVSVICNKHLVDEILGEMPKDKNMTQMGKMENGKSYDPGMNMDVMIPPTPTGATEQ